MVFHANFMGLYIQFTAWQMSKKIEHRLVGKPLESDFHPMGRKLGSMLVPMLEEVLLARKVDDLGQAS